MESVMANKKDFNIVDLESEDPSWEKMETSAPRGRKNSGSGGRKKREAGGENLKGGALQGNALRGRSPREPKGPGGNGTVVATVFISLGVLCLIIGGVFFLRSRMEAKKNQEQMEVLNSQEQSEPQTEDGLQQSAEQTENTGESGAVQSGTDAGQETEGAEQTASGETESTAPVPVPNPYAESYLQNEDMVGWLKIEGTKVDYPVMQTMDDENYYLKRGFDKKNNQNGCLILDTDSKIKEPLSTNLIIHGHNMKSGEMFGNLTDYEDEKYYADHKNIKLFTEECERNYEVIAVFRSQVFKKTDDVFKFYKFFQADTQEEFDDWYGNIKSMSQYDTGVTAELGDRFLTLSTCVYHVENGRLVVVAKEIEPGDYYEPIK